MHLFHTKRVSPRTYVILYTPPCMRGFVWLLMKIYDFYLMNLKSNFINFWNLYDLLLNCSCLKVSLQTNFQGKSRLKKMFFRTMFTNTGWVKDRGEIWLTWVSNRRLSLDERFYVIPTKKQLWWINDRFSNSCQITCHKNWYKTVFLVNFVS